MDNTTPSLEEVIGSTMEPVADSTLPVSETSTEVKTETTEPAKPESEEETFVKVDPKTLAPELQAVYKQWQKSYTERRQQDKAKIREYEEKLSKFEQSQQTQTDPQVPQVENPQPTEEMIQKKVETVLENRHIEEAEKSFFELDERLNADSPEHDEYFLNAIAGKLGSARQKFEDENGSVLGFDFIGQAKQLIAEYDYKMEKGNQAYLQRQKEMAKANSAKSSQVNPRTSSVSGKSVGNMNLDEAFEKAMEEHGSNF